MIRGQMVDTCQCSVCPTRRRCQSVINTGTLFKVNLGHEIAGTFVWVASFGGRVPGGILPSRSWPFMLRPSEAEDDSPALAILLGAAPRPRVEVDRMNEGAYNIADCNLRVKFCADYVGVLK